MSCGVLNQKSMNHNFLALLGAFCYVLWHLNFVPKLRYTIRGSILSIENTPQASPCEAQTGGFIIFGGYHAL